MATRAQMMASRAGRGARLNARLEWFGERIRAGVVMGMNVRLRFAAQYIRDKIVFNISIPVLKLVGADGGQVVAGRSLPGEFPRAETTRLMKDIFYREESPMNWQVGMTLDYGVVLETRMNRSFMVRTLQEERANLRNILVQGRGVSGDGTLFDDSPI